MAFTLKTNPTLLLFLSTVLYISIASSSADSSTTTELTFLNTVGDSLRIPLSDHFAGRDIFYTLDNAPKYAKVV